MDKKNKYLELVELEDLDPEKINYTHMNRIIKALDYLRAESKKIGNEDIESLINSTFNIILIAYVTALRASGRKDIVQNQKKSGTMN